MNIKSKLTLCLGLLLAPLALPAWSPQTAYVESYLNRTDVPVPTSVTIPDVGSEFAGQRLMLRFVVNADGKPSLITSVTPGADNELVASVAEAVAAWRFNPALVNGRPAARAVLLPVIIAAKPSTCYLLN